MLNGAGWVGWGGAGEKEKERAFSVQKTELLYMLKPVEFSLNLANSDGRCVDVCLTKLQLPQLIS